MNKIIAILAVVIPMVIGCTGEEKSSKSMEQIYKEDGIPVKVQTVKSSEFFMEHSFHGILTGFQESNASAALADKIEKVHYRVGDQVQKDAVVISFPIDNPAAQYYQAKVILIF